MADPAVLKDARRLKLRELLRGNRTILDRDKNGAPIVRGEVLAVSLSDTDMALAQAAGFLILRVRVLEGLDARVVVLAAPQGLDTQRALSRLREVLPSATLDFNHIYTDSGSDQASGEGSRGAAGDASARAPADANTRHAASGISDPSDSTMTRPRVGLIDGGLDVGHGAFKSLVIHQHGCSGSPVPSPHGTAVASLLIGQSGGFHGAAAGAELYAADVFCGLPTGGAADAVADALAWLAHEHVAVINVSLVGPPDATLETVVRLVVARGHIIVAAVGNDGPAAAPLYPASYPGVVGVTGVDARRRVLVEACRGPQVRFAAPGADMSAAKSSQTFEVVRGTSYAAPLVAGLLAAMLHEPDPVAAARVVEDLTRRALDVGASGPDTTYGYGLVGADLAPPPKLAGLRAQ